jgi:2-polyprenyl-3-methyl-5-hydroxy-6-metoxy-1,4-benzoquinol methylase
LLKNLSGTDVRRHGDAIVHPSAFAPRGDDSIAAKVSEVPGDLRLGTAKNLHEVADTNLLLAHKVQEPETGVVTECLEEPFHVEWVLCCHESNIYALTYSWVGNIVTQANVLEGGMSEHILDSVKSKYGAVAESTLSNDHAGVKAVAEAFGYSAEELTSIPAGANMGLSCGNPTATAHLRPGEVVVDLGSGGGLDVFLASRMVGPEGRAIGIDMTTAMIERSRENAKEGGYGNVEFYQSTIDQIPLPDSSVDCIISNCVVNLAPDKPAVFREIARVLKPCRPQRHCVKA